MIALLETAEEGKWPHKSFRNHSSTINLLDGGLNSESLSFKATLLPIKFSNYGRQLLKMTILSPLSFSTSKGVGYPTMIAIMNTKVGSAVIQLMFS